MNSCCGAAELFRSSARPALRKRDEAMPEHEAASDSDVSFG